MTGEFKIDKPGVYKTRNDRRVYVWPLLFSREWWNGEDGNSGAAAASELYRTDGRLLETHETAFDLVAYAGPLPAEILQRMAEALEAAEYQLEQTAPATFGEVLKAMAEAQPKPTYEQREKHACDVCGNVPDEEGFIQHGRGCHVVNEDGGGITLVDFDEGPKQ